MVGSWSLGSWLGLLEGRVQDIPDPLIPDIQDPCDITLGMAGDVQVADLRCRGRAGIETFLNGLRQGGCGLLGGCGLGGHRSFLSVLLMCSFEHTSLYEQTTVKSRAKKQGM